MSLYSSLPALASISLLTESGILFPENEIWILQVKIWILKTKFDEIQFLQEKPKIYEIWNFQGENEIPISSEIEFS